MTTSKLITSKRESSVAKPRLVVGVADAAVSSQADAVVITYALGSCIGLTAYDPQKRIGGLLHYMLPKAPDSEVEPAKPYMYGDRGILLMLEKLRALGADRNRLILCAAGAAEVMADNGVFEIGKRNRTIMRKLLWRENLKLSAEATGGQKARTLSFDLADGTIRIKAGVEESILWNP